MTEQYNHPALRCGNCGYPTRGIAELRCPECGADLREVGIDRSDPSSRRAKTLVIALIYSTVFLIAATAVWNRVESNLPYSVKTNARIKLHPVSDEYKALIRIETHEVIWFNRPSKGDMSFDLSSNDHPPAAPMNTSLKGLLPTRQISSLTMTVDPASPPNGAWNAPELRVDPNSRMASWTGLKGIRARSQAAMTDQDVQAFLASAGADPNNPDVINEANQLYLMMDGLAQKKTQFTLAGFSTFGGGGGTSSTRHPGWYPIMYLLLATVLWLIGLILIIRRGRRTQHRSE